MPLFNVTATMHYLTMYRVCHIDGRYGGGKTASAFRFGYEMVKKGFARYLISNVASVWNDNPDDIVMREGRYVDAVVILDEGGLFLKTGRDADKFLAYLRKLNITLLMPSVDPPAQKLRKLSIQRTMNLHVLGLPLWVYTTELNYGSQSEKVNWIWRRPKEIYGIYDTLGVPSDDTMVYLRDPADPRSIEMARPLDDYMQKWVKNIAERSGYVKTAQKGSGTGGGFVDHFAAGGSAVDDEISDPEMGSFAGVIGAISEAAESNLEAANIQRRTLEKQKSKRKGGLLR